MSYTFLPWLREGAAGDLPRAAGTARNRLLVDLQLVVNDSPTDAPLHLRLLGPGDVVGFDQRQVVRTDPPNQARGVEPNYFPFVEFDQPSFPWLFTPAAPDAANRLRPWLCLVVVRQQDGVRIEPDPATKVTMLTVEPPAAPALELPDLAESWAWAHVQVTGKASSTELVRVLANQPERSLARLVCPRRLRPGATYHACVVPAFAAGVSAATGQPVDDNAALADAWTATAARVDLPVYYRWQFSTGEIGDFETLANALHAGQISAGLGRRSLDLEDPGFGLPTGAGGQAVLQGALRVPGDEPPPAPAWFAARLAGLLGAADEGSVRPPLYGGTQAGVATLPGSGWLARLNLEPGYRAAAGLGARIVREQQEQLMEAAWTQAGAIDAANRFLSRSQLARSVGESVWQRRLTPLAEEAPAILLQVTAPVHLPAGSLRARIRAGQLPDATLDPAFRRLTRPRGPHVRRFAGSANDSGPPAVRVLARRVGDLDPHEVLAELEPGQAQRDRVASQVKSPAELALLDRPDPIAPITRAPEFPAPMSLALQRLSVDYLLPGSEHLLADTVVVLEPNRPFVAAFMAGLNHEMSRELRWREYPTDPAPTCFRVFWDRRGQAPAGTTLDDLADIAPIALWPPGEELGDRVRSDPAGELVVVVRSELLRRYPRAVVYAARAAAATPRRVLADESDPANRMLPRFAGFLDPDIGFFGFGLGAAAARGDADGLGWFFVFQEQPSEPRFGLDEAKAGWLPDPPPQPMPGTGQQRPALVSSNLAWGHLVDQQHFATLAHAPVSGARPARWWFPDRPDLAWAGGAADLAALTLQRPARVALHAQLLLPKAGPHVPA
jgi:hypothetical protein